MRTMDVLLVEENAQRITSDQFTRLLGVVNEGTAQVYRSKPSFTGCPSFPYEDDEVFCEIIRVWEEDDMVRVEVMAPDDEETLIDLLGGNDPDIDNVLVSFQQDGTPVFYYS